MTRTHRTSALALVLIAVLIFPRPAHAQVTANADIWRAFAEKLDTGKTLKVRLMSGQRFKATLLQVSAEGITVQPRTRVPVPPQVVSFTDVASLEVDAGKGASMAKAVAVGAAVAAGTFFALMAWAFAVWGD
jgi:hypothetical protein